MHIPRFGLAQRRLEPELMDDLHLDPGLHYQALRGLRRINRVSRTAHTLWQPLKAHYHRRGRIPLRVLDIASGAGDIVIELAALAAKEKLPVIFEGCDYNPRTVSYAREQALKQGFAISFFQWDALQEPVPERFDAVINSLFLHHLNEQHLVRFLRTLSVCRAKLILLCDLKRSWRGLGLCYLGTRCLSRSAIVHQDGILSVKAAFTSAEIRKHVGTAGWHGVKFRSVWPMRYLLTWDRT